MHIYTQFNIYKTCELYKNSIEYTKSIPGIMNPMLLKVTHEQKKN